MFQCTHQQWEPKQMLYSYWLMWVVWTVCAWNCGIVKDIDKRRTVRQWIFLYLECTFILCEEAEEMMQLLFEPKKKKRCRSEDINTGFASFLSNGFLWSWCCLQHLVKLDENGKTWQLLIKLAQFSQYTNEWREKSNHDNDRFSTWLSVSLLENFKRAKTA